MSFTSPVLTLEVNENVVTLWLDRPDRRNAISEQMWVDIPKAITAVADNEQVRSLIIAARGDSFCDVLINLQR